MRFSSIPTVRLEQSIYDNAVQAARRATTNTVKQEEQERKNDEHAGEEVGAAAGTRRDSSSGSAENAALILVSKSTLNDLSEQIALSLNKMKDLEDQVRVIPELQRRLDQIVASDSCSSSLTGKELSSSGSIMHHQHQFHHCSSSNLHKFAPTRVNNGARRDSASSRLFNVEVDNNNDTYRNKTKLDYISSLSNNRNVDNNNITASVEDVYRGVHPMLQRHYNSFRQQQQQQTTLATHKPQSSTPLVGAAPAAARFSANVDQTSSSPAHLHQPHHSHFGNNLNHHQIPFTSNFNQNLTSSNNMSNGSVSSKGYHPSSYSSSKMSFHNNGSGGSLSLQTTPVKSTPLDCGCQSFKEHLKYNSISREQRLHAQQQQHQQQQVRSFNNLSISSTTNSTAVSPQPSSIKVDASTNTDLGLADVVTREELNNVMTNMQKTFSNLSTWILNRETARENASDELIQFKSSKSSAMASKLPRKSPSSTSDSSSSSVCGPKSSSPLDSQSTDDENDYQSGSDLNYERNSESSSNKDRAAVGTAKSSALVSSHERAEEGDDDDVHSEDEANSSNLQAEEEPYSLGSSYQDPSDFEEYCAYDESLDRRTRDFMSQSTKIPNDLRFALIRLNDFIKRSCSFEQIESTSNCVEVIRKDWFRVAASKDSLPATAKLYVNYFESFTKHLLNIVVNLADTAGNTALHYAASHYKLDVIKILLETKVCDVNRRNKAGYTPIMLLALGDIPGGTEEREVARSLFSIGDVNIKARSSGQTALMLAASHGRATTCKLLLDCGADPTIRDHDGSTALMCGSEIGNEEVVRCLLAHKSTDPTITDNDGLDALTIAMNNGHKNIGLILYAAKNVPGMVRSKFSPADDNTSSSTLYSAASLRKIHRDVISTNSVRRTAFTCWSTR